MVTVQSSTPTCLDHPEVLLKRGIELRQYQNGPSALIGIGSNRPQIVIAPTDMAGIDVVDFVGALVAATALPVLVGVFAAEDSHTSGFHALENGARGMLSIPASGERLAEAISHAGLSMTTMGPDLTAGQLTLHQLSLRVTIGQSSIQLAPKEFEILKFLMMGFPRVLSVEQILAHLDDSSQGGSTRIRLAILRIRKKLAGAQNQENSLIETVRGVGYRVAL